MDNEFEAEARSMQQAINGGHAWDMEGSMGRAMMDWIDNGFCILGPDRYERAYGLGMIGSRYDVVPGTKGSIEYARKKQPRFWVDRKVDWAD